MEKGKTEKGPTKTPLTEYVLPSELVLLIVLSHPSPALTVTRLGLASKRTYREALNSTLIWKGISEHLDLEFDAEVLYKRKLRARLKARPTTAADSDDYCQDTLFKPSSFESYAQMKACRKLSQVPAIAEANLRHKRAIARVMWEIPSHGGTQKVELQASSNDLALAVQSFSEGGWSSYVGSWATIYWKSSILLSTNPKHEQTRCSVGNKHYLVGGRFLYRKTLAGEETIRLPHSEPPKQVYNKVICDAKEDNETVYDSGPYHMPAAPKPVPDSSFYSQYVLVAQLKPDKTTIETKLVNLLAGTVVDTLDGGGWTLFNLRVCQLGTSSTTVFDYSFSPPKKYDIKKILAKFGLSLRKTISLLEDAIICAYIPPKSACHTVIVPFKTPRNYQLLPIDSYHAQSGQMPANRFFIAIPDRGKLQIYKREPSREFSEPIAIFDTYAPNGLLNIKWTSPGRMLVYLNSPSNRVVTFDFASPSFNRSVKALLFNPFDNSTRGVRIDEWNCLEDATSLLGKSQTPAAVGSFAVPLASPKGSTESFRLVLVTSTAFGRPCIWHPMRWVDPKEPGALKAVVPTTKAKLHRRGNQKPTKQLDPYKTYFKDLTVAIVQKMTPKGWKCVNYSRYDTRDNLGLFLMDCEFL